MKKFVSMFLVLAISMSLASFALANEIVPEDINNKGSLIYENSEIKAYSRSDDSKIIVTVEYGNYYEIATRDTTTNSITTQIFDYNSTLLSTETTTVEDDGIMPADYYQHTFSNYEYDVNTSGRHEVWTCRRKSDYKTIAARTELAKSNLALWKNSVDTINSRELKLISAVGVNIAKTVISALGTSGLGGALTFIQTSSVAVAATISLSEGMKAADKVFAKL